MIKTMSTTKKNKKMIKKGNNEHYQKKIFWKNED